MNVIGLRCTVSDGKGKVLGVICTDDNQLYNFGFSSPSIYSFNTNVGEILNWHRDNIISLLAQFNIDAIAIKKSERESFQGRPKNSDIFKIYLEGVLLSLAGNIGLINQHYYKNNIKAILENETIYDESLQDITKAFGKTYFKAEIPQMDMSSTKDALLAALAIEKQINND